MITQTRVKELLIAIAIFFSLSLPSIAGEIINRIVAVVNNELITMADLKKADDAVRTKSRKALTDEEERKILDALIEQKLVEQEAKKQGYLVTDSEVDATIENIKKRFGLNENEMQSTLRKQNLTMEGFREQWRKQLLMNKIITSRLKGQIVVTDEEIDKYYKDNQSTLETIEEIRVSHILIPVLKPEDEAKAEKQALQVLRLAGTGKNFVQLAKQYSKDASSAANGGDLGFFKKGDMAEELEKALIGTPVGDIVGPIRSAAGYHILKVTDKKKAEVTSLENSREQIKDTIYQQKVETAIKSWLEDVKKTAYIEIKL